MAREHRETAIDETLARFESSFREIFSLAQELSEREMMTPGHFAWTGKNPLTTYLGANTTSHYRTATKIVRRWLKAQAAAADDLRQDSP